MKAEAGSDPGSFRVTSYLLIKGEKRTDVMVMITGYVEEEKFRTFGYSALLSNPS